MAKSISSHPTHSRSTVRLSGPGGVVTLIPQMLGFWPERSLVLVTVTGSSGRVGPIVRNDLEPLDEYARQVRPSDPKDDPILAMADCAAHYGDRAMIVAFHDDESRPPCLDALADALVHVDIPVDLMLSVRDGRIRRADSDHAYAHDTGCHVPSADDPQYQRLAAATALNGRQVLPDRDALAASIAPSKAPDPQVNAAIAQATEAMFTQFGKGVFTCPLEPELSTFLDITLRDALTERDETGILSSDMAGLLIAAACTTATRDHLIGAVIAGDTERYLPTLIAAAAQCPDGDAPGMCSVLAVAAYRSGDGALAHCALDRVVLAEPDHRLADLLRAFIVGGLPPEQLDCFAE